MKIRNSVCVFFCLWVVFLGTAWGSSSTKITYTYDESNKRIAQDIENQGKTLFIYDVQDRLIAEMDAAGNTLVEYIYLNGRQIAMANKTGQPDEALYLTHTDHLGTPEVMTDTSGNEVWRREQTPFGETVKIEGSITQNMRFLGQRYHEETGLHYNLNRDYNPSIGQYVQSDPIGMAGGINTFVYANNNPVMYSDPEGLNPLLLLYGAYKLGSFAYDLYDTYQTATDPCSSSWAMAMAIGVTGADLLNPLGAGLSRAMKVGKVAKEGTTRVRHYTNRRGSKGIEQDGVIKAQDNNRVYVEPANKKPLNQIKAESKYQLKPGRGRDFVETDVPNSQLEWVNNPRYGTPELTAKGDLPLNNPAFTRRK